MPIISGGGGGGGGAAPTTRGIYNLAHSALAATTGVKLTWSFSGGTALLDLSDTALPTPLVSGVYALTVWVVASAVVSPTAIIQTWLELDGNNLDPAPPASAPMNAASIVGATSPVGMGLTFYNPVASPLTVWAFHTDTGHTPDIAGVAYVQQIS